MYAIHQSTNPYVSVLQLEQLEKESLQHTQQKAEQFGRKGHQVSRFTNRSERDPFAGALATDKYANLESASEDGTEGTGTTAVHYKLIKLCKRYRYHVVVTTVGTVCWKNVQAIVFLMGHFVVTLASSWCLEAAVAAPSNGILDGETL